MQHETLKKIADDNVRGFLDEVKHGIYRFALITCFVVYAFSGTGMVYYFGAFVAFACILSFVFAIVGYIGVHLKNNFIAQAAILDRLDKQE